MTDKEKDLEQLVHNFEQTVRDIYGDGFIPLHRPIFEGNERRYLVDCIDSNFVSSVGQQVIEFERAVADFTGNKYAIATVNGTAALHAALECLGVTATDEVVTQALTFVATANAITYTGAHPVFVDVDRDSMGMSPVALENFLSSQTECRDGGCFNRKTGRRVAAVLPMHTFGFPCRVDEISRVCERWNIPLVEDCAESLGSYRGAHHTGTFGQLSTFSFNGNKVITTGGGGMIVTNRPDLAEMAKHLTTTAKIPHAYEFVHDHVGFNYRLPNLNAALGVAQMEELPRILEAKNQVSFAWRKFSEANGVDFVEPLHGDTANYWLNALVLPSKSVLSDFLRATNALGVMTRPLWNLMSDLPMFKECQTDGLQNSKWLRDRVVNIPSSVP